MARAIWSGSINFGLVNIPIKLVTAIREKDLKFNQLHAKDGSRIKYKKVCAKDGDEVPNDEIVKGYEVTPGQYVTLTDDELEAADPKRTRTVEIEDFVDQVQIDPMYYDKPYFLVPDKNAHKAYRLLLEALVETDKVGLARMVMHDKEHLVAIRARDGALVMETMYFHDELVPVSSLQEDLEADIAPADKRQVALAQQLIESLSAEFEPKKYKDHHRERVQDIIGKKAAGKKITVETASAPAGRTADLLVALEASLAKAKKAQKKGK
ncbi:MAG: Ku protein [Candidatus Thermoplasmatota archaeon]